MRAKDGEITKLVEKEATHAKELQTAEKRGKESVARREAQINELKARVERLSVDTAKIQKEKDDVERKLNEDLEKEKEMRETEKAAAAAVAAAASKSSAERRNSISYIRMPPPPIPPNIPTSGPVPRAPSSGTGSIRQRARPMSVGSQSSMGSAPYEIVQSPPGSGRRLFSHSTIPQIAPPLESQNSRVVNQGPPDPNFLLPAGSRLYGLPDGNAGNGSQSTIQINIEPPVSCYADYCTPFSPPCLSVSAAFKR